VLVNRDFQDLGEIQCTIVGRLLCKHLVSSQPQNYKLDQGQRPNLVHYQHFTVWSWSVSAQK